MQATIKFEADVGKVRNIMYSLVLEETGALSDAINCMESIADATSDRLIEGISEALAHIQGASRQLEQYRDMVTSFEMARLDTKSSLPTEHIKSQVNSLKDAVLSVAQMKAFDSFVGSISSEEATEDVPTTEEG